MAVPSLTIVIPAYNEAQRIGSSLELVRQYVRSKSFSVELILVDDGSTDSTPELMREFARACPWARILRHDPL